MEMLRFDGSLGVSEGFGEIHRARDIREVEGSVSFRLFKQSAMLQ